MEHPDTMPDWLRRVSVLRAGRFNSEDALQIAIAEILTAERVPHCREDILTPTERIDFSVEWEGQRWGIECKISGAQAVWRQLARYASHFDALVLVTTRPVGENIGVFKDGEKPMPFHLVSLWKNF